MARRKGKTLRVTCCRCGAESAPYTITSPAAPELSVCEQAEKDGWSFTVDFWAMMTGDHRTVCPDCTREGEHHA